MPDKNEDEQQSASVEGASSQDAVRDDDAAAAQAAGDSSAEVAEGNAAVSTGSFDALVLNDPAAPHKPKADADDADAGDAADVGEDGAAPSSRGNALGVWSVIIGALLLFPIALALGHLGLRANRVGEANNRRVALAGVILGYLGLAVALVGTAAALFVVQPKVASYEVDNAARADVINIGNAVVAEVLAGNPLPTITVAGPDYLVGEQAVTSQLDTPGNPSPVAGINDHEWCLEINYQGGSRNIAAFKSTTGLVSSGLCSPSR